MCTYLLEEVLDEERARMARVEDIVYRACSYEGAKPQIDALGHVICMSVPCGRWKQTRSRNNRVIT